MRFHTLAADYDGTLANEGVVDPRTVSALERLVASGRRLVIVTGRELQPLRAIFPQLTLAARVVAENGAVVYAPDAGTERALAPAPPAAFADELRRRGVSPLSVGRCVVATLEPHGDVVNEVIAALDLDLHVVANKGSLMILPKGVTKASGLAAALIELGVSAHDVVAVGDAENDHALLGSVGYGVAVANATPALKRAAHRVTHFPFGAGVAELIDEIISTDLARATV